MAERREGVLIASAAPGGERALLSWEAEPTIRTRTGDLTLPRTGARPRNIVIILTDDHRYDAMGFMRTQDFVETPVLDRLAREGAHLRNAFVTTALCSPRPSHPGNPADRMMCEKPASWTDELFPPVSSAERVGAQIAVVWKLV